MIFNSYKHNPNFFEKYLFSFILSDHQRFQESISLHTLIKNTESELEN